jgi:hypothetical protein
MARTPNSTHAIVHASDSPMGPLLTSLDRVAASEANVLVVGESGWRVSYSAMNAAPSPVRIGAMQDV